MSEDENTIVVEKDGYTATIDKNTGKKVWESEVRVNTAPSVLSYNGYIYAFDSDRVLKYETKKGTIV